jgi:hypothetical protein
MNGFVKTNVAVTTEYKSPEGNSGRNVEFVPKDIRDLSDEAWESPQYLHATLTLVLGAVREFKSKDGKDLKARDIFLGGCQGPKGPSGRNYRNLRVGSILQGTSIDEETKESRLWTAVNLEGLRKASSTETPAKAEAPVVVENL